MNKTIRLKKKPYLSLHSLQIRLSLHPVHVVLLPVHRAPVTVQLHVVDLAQRLIRLLGHKRLLLEDRGRTGLEEGGLALTTKLVLHVLLPLVQASLDALLNLR
jgi:hypothetical protein